MKRILTALAVSATLAIGGAAFLTSPPTFAREAELLRGRDPQPQPVVSGTTQPTATASAQPTAIASATAEPTMVAPVQPSATASVRPSASATATVRPAASATASPSASPDDHGGARRGSDDPGKTPHP
jgi:hypothetical protein